MKSLVIVLAVGVSAYLHAQSLSAPTLALAQDGSTVTAHWSTVDGALGYRLHYAPYPALAPIKNIDMGLALEVSADFSPENSFVLAVSAYEASGQGPLSNTPVAQLDLEKSGGETSIKSLTSNAFSTPAPNLTEEELDLHLDGDTDFGAVFVTAPAPVNSGLGPVFNHSACEACHARDGRDAAPDDGEFMDTMFLRLSLPGADPTTGGPLPVPDFGVQLATKAVFGKLPEATVKVNYSEELLVLASGREVKLRTPSIDIEANSQLPDNVQWSPRIGPPVFGRGLLEAIPEEAILSVADENDLGGDGISGKANFVWDTVTESTVLGRFGLKANAPSVLVQSAGAYHQDIGVTTSVFPIESSVGQAQADDLADDPELSDEDLQAVTFYVQTLAVPERRNIDSPEVELGQLVFAQAGCASCHVPTLKTGLSDVSPALSNQIIHPYTDMLLHDMGPSLADNRPDFLADGYEWRTAPLWGIGMTKIVNGHTSFLHDGRARNVLEAIMWHGGEAQAARDYVADLPAMELDALLAFINSL